MDDGAAIEDSEAVGRAPPERPRSVDRSLGNLARRQRQRPRHVSAPSQAAAHGPLPLGLGGQAPATAGRVPEPLGERDGLEPGDPHDRLIGRREGAIAPPGRRLGARRSPPGRRAYSALRHRRAPEREGAATATVLTGRSSGRPRASPWRTFPRERERLEGQGIGGIGLGRRRDQLVMETGRSRLRRKIAPEPLTPEHPPSRGDLMLLCALLLAAAAPCATPTLVTPAQKKGRRGRSARRRCAADIRFLSSDLLEGRGPATPGETLSPRPTSPRAWRPWASSPARPDGGWLQPFEVVGVREQGPGQRPRHPRRRGRRSASPARTTSPSRASKLAESRLENAEIVFVGYGIVAPEYDWDDYKGAGPQGQGPAGDEQRPRGRPALFAGKTRLYYGRWRLQVRAGGAPGRGRAPSSSTRRPPPATGGRWCRPRTRASVSLPAEGETAPAREGLGHRGGVPQDRRASAARISTRCVRPPQKRDFKPVPLGVTLSLTLAERGRAQADAPTSSADPRQRSRLWPRKPSSTPPTTTTWARRPTPSRARTRSTTAPSTTPPASRACSRSPRR